MTISIIGRQLTIRDSLRELIEDKVSKFEKFFDENTVMYVTCKARKGTKIIELTVNYKDTLFRSEEESDTFRTALDRALDSFEKQIRKNKTRLQKRVHAQAFEYYDELEEYEEEGEFQIHEKKFEMKPMTVEEAILQMNLLGHQFFVFQDQDTSKTCVVYKRKDGDYGLISPEQ